MGKSFVLRQNFCMVFAIGVPSIAATDFTQANTPHILLKE